MKTDSPHFPVTLGDRAITAISTRSYAVSIVLFALAALLLLKNVNLVSPIMAGDEYAYFGQAREFPNIANVLTYDKAAAQTYNIFYFWCGHLLWKYASDPALTMRASQALLYMLMFPIFYFLCRQFLSRPKSMVLTLVGLVTARSSYSAYFMPETVYDLLFFLLIFLAVHFYPRLSASSLSSGILVAVLTLTKPHGIALALGLGMTWVVCILFPRLVGIGRRRSLLALGVFIVAYYVGLVSSNALLMNRLQFNPLNFVGDSYANFWVSRPHPMAPLRDLLTAIAGNAVPLALLIGFPIIYTLLWMVRRISANKDTSTPLHEKEWFFVILIICVSTITLGMTINFTAQVGGEEIWRMHGRYYSFIIPFFVLLMFIAAENQSTHEIVQSAWIIRASAIMGFALLAIVQFSWRTAYAVAPWDFPEIFALSTWDWLPGSRQFGTELVLFCAAVFAAILIWPSRGPYLFAGLFVVFNLAGLDQTTRWQFAHSRALSKETAPAAALRLLIPPEDLDRGVIIAADRGDISYVLITLRSRSRVLMLPANSVVDATTVGGASWVLLDGTFDVRLNTSRVMLHQGTLTFLLLRDLPPFIPGTGSPSDRLTAGSKG